MIDRVQTAGLPGAIDAWAGWTVAEGTSLLLLSTILLALGLLAGRLLRSRGPVYHSLAYRAALAATLGACALSLWPSIIGERAFRPRSGLPPRIAAPTIAPPSAEATQEGAPIPQADAAPAWSLPVVRVSVPSPTRDAARLLAALWLTGTLFLLGWLGLSHCFVLRQLGRSAPAGRAETELLAAVCGTLGVRPPRLLETPRLAGPVAIVCPARAILLPEGFAGGLALDARRAVLAHEAAHLARGDCWWSLLCRLMTALLWPQPLLWILVSRLHEAAEEACDMEAARFGHGRREYARLLLDLARRRGGGLPLAVGVSGAPFRSSLGRRIAAVLC